MKRNTFLTNSKTLVHIPVSCQHHISHLAYPREHGRWSNYKRRCRQSHQGEFPALRQTNCQTNRKCRHVLKKQSNIVSNTIVDFVDVTETNKGSKVSYMAYLKTKLISYTSILLLGHSSVKFTHVTAIKPADVLCQNGMKKLFSNSLGLSCCSHNPKGNLHVAKNQGSNSYSNIIQGQPEKKRLLEMLARPKSNFFPCYQHLPSNQTNEKEPNIWIKKSHYLTKRIYLFLLNPHSRVCSLIFERKGKKKRGRGKRGGRGEKGKEEERGVERGKDTERERDINWLVPDKLMN